jgi:hypothetical protein
VPEVGDTVDFQFSFTYSNYGILPSLQVREAGCFMTEPEIRSSAATKSARSVAFERMACTRQVRLASVSRAEFPRRNKAA